MPCSLGCVQVRNRSETARKRSSRKHSLRFPLAGYKPPQANGRQFSLRRVGPGCLFWIVASVVLSVILTILLNLPLLFFG